ncbi:DUF485 domain-containing protein [Chloroflexota bacterium]
MEHGAPTEFAQDKCEGYKTKLGFVMIVIYTIVYFAFIVLAVTNPKLLGMDVGSLNLAIVYGFSIIILAMIQALIYNYVCSRREKDEEMADPE